MSITSSRTAGRWHPSQLYDEALAGWSRREISTQTGNGAADRGRTEVLWCNRPWAAATLFE